MPWNAWPQLSTAWTMPWLGCVSAASSQHWKVGQRRAWRDGCRRWSATSKRLGSGPGPWGALLHVDLLASDVVPSLRKVLLVGCRGRGWPEIYLNIKEQTRGSLRVNHHHVPTVHDLNSRSTAVLPPWVEKQVGSSQKLQLLEGQLKGLQVKAAEESKRFDPRLHSGAAAVASSVRCLVDQLVADRRTKPAHVAPSMEVHAGAWSRFGNITDHNCVMRSGVVHSCKNMRSAHAQAQAPKYLPKHTHMQYMSIRVYISIKPCTQSHTQI